MKYLLSILFLIFSLCVKSQNSFSLKNIETNEPIQYANIWLANKILTSTDSLGNFVIRNSNILSEIKVTAVGFKTLNNLSLIDKSTLFMEQEIYELNEVVLVDRLKNKTSKIGNIKNGNVSVCAEMSHNISEVGVFFENNLALNLYLQKIKFKSLCLNKDAIISVNIYSVGSNGEPKDIVNKENIICKLRKGHNTNEIDLTELEMIFPKEGLFIVFNYLFLEQNKRFSDENTKNWYVYEPSLDAEKTNEFSNTWYNINNEWKKAESYSLNIQLYLTN
jgi:hypothetical protein